MRTASESLWCATTLTRTRAALSTRSFPLSKPGYIRRIEFCYTPKHGSWLNIAENELSCMTRQCMYGRRLGELARLQQEIAAWSIDTTKAQRGVDWHMIIDDARCKLTSVYPKILV